MTKAERDELRTAIADYMRSEGCSCCRDFDGHNEHARRIGKLLRVPLYSDKSGYDFYRFITKREAQP